MSKEAAEALDNVRRQMFNEAQAELPLEQRAYQLGEEMCGSSLQGWRCTCKKDHKGDHCAHGSLGTICSKWTDEDISAHEGNA